MSVAVAPFVLTAEQIAAVAKLAKGGEYVRLWPTGTEDVKVDVVLDETAEAYFLVSENGSVRAGS